MSATTSKSSPEIQAVRQVKIATALSLSLLLPLALAEGTGPWLSSLGERRGLAPAAAPEGAAEGGPLLEEPGHAPGRGAQGLLRRPCIEALRDEGSVVNLAPQSLVATLLLRGCPHTVTSPGSASRKAACARELLTPQLTPVVPVSPEFTLALYIA